MGVQIWTPRRQCHRFDPNGLEDPVERCTEFCISIRLIGSGSVSCNRPLIWFLRIQFSVTRYSLRRRSS